MPTAILILFVVIFLYPLPFLRTFFYIPLWQKLDTTLCHVPRNLLKSLPWMFLPVCWFRVSRYIAFSIFLVTSRSLSNNPRLRGPYHLTFKHFSYKSFDQHSGHPLSLSLFLHRWLSQKIQSLPLVLLGDLNVHVVGPSNVQYPVITTVATLGTQGHVITWALLYRWRLKCLSSHPVYALTPSSLLNVSLVLLESRYPLWSCHLVILGPWLLLPLFSSSTWSTWSVKLVEFFPSPLSFYDIFPMKPKVDHLDSLSYPCVCTLMPRKYLKFDKSQTKYRIFFLLKALLSPNMIWWTGRRNPGVDVISYLCYWNHLPRCPNQKPRIHP